MSQIIAIAIGGSVGALSRHFVAQLVYAWLGRDYPYGTLTVNVSGCFLMGFLTVYIMQRETWVDEYRGTLLIGFLGAYTTFSSFALESFYLFETSNIAKALLNVITSVVFSIMALWLGIVLGRKIYSDSFFEWLPLLPYIELLLGIIAGLALAALSEYLFLNWDIRAGRRLIGQICLLGILAIALTLWLSYKMFNFEIKLFELLAVFISSSLIAMLFIWMGMVLADWLWQFKEPR